ncbi:MAG TPA: bifunctional chorismate mutase/prephenate dehydrogenase [Gemmatimonadaceae bacterium]|jgi:chorismate mutase/prephenate dehydrogenase|nr:bifunctional chorismate mutase/prephenate dehydrogenase [Gemmatimonadaceae bacterium]
MTDQSRSLSLLRAMVDATDRDILQAISRRMGLVREIADVKRAAGLRIRDVQREQEVLEDRMRVASELGLPPGEMESLFRLLLRASRDYQALLRVEVLPDEHARTVTIIGGHGRMGRVFSAMFADLGHRVLIVDLDTDLSAADAAAVSDVVVVSVPIDRTEDVIREVGPALRPESLLTDLTSVKQEPVAAMLASTKASVVGMHPMFGPSVHTLQGQRVVLCRARGDTWAEWLAHTLTSHGMVITETTPDNHDRVMSIVQVLTHYQTQVMGLTLARLGVPLEETLRFTSPVYLLELYMTARHFAQSPALYGEIEMRNPRATEVTGALRTAADEVAAAIERRDHAAFTALFDEVREFLGSFTTEALQQSSYLVDRIVERT